VVYLKRISSIPVAVKVDYMVPRIVPIAPLLLLVDNFRPIRVNIKSTVAITLIEKKIKKKTL